VSFFKGVGETPNLVLRLFQNREDPGDEVGDPRFSKCIFLLLKLRYFYLGTENGNKSS